MSLMLDFEASPRPNPFNALNATIEKLAKNKKALQDGSSLKWSILCVALNMGYQNSMSVSLRFELLEAVIKMQSYLAGYSKPQFTTAYFLRTYLRPWLVVNESENVNPFFVSVSVNFHRLRDKIAIRTKK